MIAAFVIGSLLAQRGTRFATEELRRVEVEIAPLTRTAREPAESSAAFDRAVLGLLGTDTALDRAQLASAGERLARAITEAPAAAAGVAAGTPPLAEALAGQQALGFRLAELRESRRRSLECLDAVYRDLARRLDSGGSSGIRVGGTVLTRPEMQDLATVETRGETRFREVLRAHDDALRRSPGLGWLSLVEEDFATVVRQRRVAHALRAETEAGQTRFTGASEALAGRIHEQYGAPAWDRFESASASAAATLRRAEKDITDATTKSIVAALLVLFIMSVLITRPVRRLTTSARRLAAGDLTTRVGRGGASEVDELACAFNQMASALDTAERAVRSYRSQLENRVTERTQQLQHLAEHDPLTDLPNRRQLFRRLSDRIGTATACGERLAVLFLDLDNFKTVNDSLGHEFGDRVLGEIGERLRLLGGESGFIARLGGDEFTLVFPFHGSVQEIEDRAGTLVARFRGH